MGKYMRGMTNWLQENLHGYDVIYVDAAREELLAAVETAQGSGTVVLGRCRGGGQSSDIQWWESSRNGKRCITAAKKAQGLVVEDAETQKELLIHGIETPLFFRIPQGVYQLPITSHQERWVIRKQLARANTDLATEADTPVLLCHAEMSSSSGLELLVGVSRLLLLRYPNLRIWLVGDGPNRDSVYNWLRAEGVRASVAIPGSFSDPSDVFRAANLYFQAGDEGLQFFLPLAISLQMPIISIDHPSIRRIFSFDGQESAVASGVPPSSGQHALDLVTWCDPSRPKTIKEGIISVLEDLPQAMSRAETLRDSMLRHRPESKTLDAQIDAIHRVSRNEL